MSERPDRLQRLERRRGPVYNVVRERQSQQARPSPHAASRTPSYVSTSSSRTPSYVSTSSSRAPTVVASSQLPPSPTSTVVVDPRRMISKRELREATRGRKGAAVFTAVLFFIAMVMLIMVNIGNTSNRPGLGQLYFFKIDVTNVIPSSVPNAQLINSLARSIGLHDFYQVGLWNFCEGYNDVGITACSQPVFMYWFNPVQIILSELLDGASITLPTNIIQYLNIIRAASHAMFLCLFISAITSFLCIFLCPLVVYSKWASLPIAFFATISALGTCVGTAIATAMFVIFRNALLQDTSQINIIPSLGFRLFILVWIAAGCSLLAALFQIGMLCCGTTRRDIKTGRRVGRKLRTEKVVVEENPALRRRWWGSMSN